MKILFTKSDYVLSKMIRGLTGEPCSHVALEFPVLDIVVQSNLLGLHIEWASNFRKNCTVVHEIEKIDGTDEEDKTRLGQMLDKFEGAWYDFGGLLFLGIAYALRTFLGIPLPKANLWQSTGMFLCVEWVTEYLNGTEDSMITPEQLYQKLKDSNEWRDCDVKSS